MGLGKDWSPQAGEISLSSLEEVAFVWGVQRVGRIWTFRNEGQKEDCQWKLVSSWGNPAWRPCPVPFSVLQYPRCREKTKCALICHYVFCLICCIISGKWIDLCMTRLGMPSWWLKVWNIEPGGVGWNPGFTTYRLLTSEAVVRKNVCWLLLFSSSSFLWEPRKAPPPTQSWRIFHHCSSITLLWRSYSKMQTHLKR